MKSEIIDGNISVLSCSLSTFFSHVILNKLKFELCDLKFVSFFYYDLCYLYPGI